MVLFLLIKKVCFILKLYLVMVYETAMIVDNLGNSVFHIHSSNGINKAFLWNCRLGHVNKKRMAQF